MAKKRTRHIWNQNTGITDFDDDLVSHSSGEISFIKEIWSDQQTQLESSRNLSDFTEKMSREWAIETGILEGLYDIERGVTQTLIEEGFRADLLSHGSTNKPPRHVIQVLRDQKDALDGIFDFVKGTRGLSISYIKELHAALLRSQDTTEGVDALGRDVEVDLIKGAWKKLPNNPVRGSETISYCPPESVDSEMDRLIDIHERHAQEDVPYEAQAAWLHHRFTQIHPFQDGNGRVARAIASLVLIKNGLFPLVVTRDDRGPYLDALETADHGDIGPLIDLIVRLQRKQFRKATLTAESPHFDASDFDARDFDVRLRKATLTAESPQAALEEMRWEADRIADHRQAKLEEVFTLAKILEDKLEDCLHEIAGTIKEILGRLSKKPTSSVDRSNDNNNYYFRAQIIENARDHIGYFANTSPYRSWVLLRIQWTRYSHIVFAIHGIGRPFNGSLICAPFLEFKDTDDIEINKTLYPLDDEGFVFFYSERVPDLVARFTTWRERVLVNAIHELRRNL